MPRENNVIMLKTKEKTKTRFNICQVGEQTEITEVNKIMINNSPLKRRKRFHYWCQMRQMRLQLIDSFHRFLSACEN